MKKVILSFWVLLFMTFNCLNAQNAPVVSTGFCASNGKRIVIPKSTSNSLGEKSLSKAFIPGHSVGVINGTSDASLSTDAPVTILPAISFCSGVSTVVVPVKVTGFTSIGALSLTLHYDSLVLVLQSSLNTSGFPGLIINSPVPGTIVLGGYVPSGSQGFTLADSSVLVTLTFSFLGGSTSLSWYDDGSSCEYSGPPPYLPTLIDTPQELHYVDGSITELYIPSAAGQITGPVAGEVCQGQTAVPFSVPVIPNATTYTWDMPSGATIAAGANTNSILVDFSNTAISGLVSVFGSSSCGNGLPSAMPLIVGSTPSNAGSVSGPQEVCQGQNQVNYSVSPILNASTYIWSLPSGASITQGFNTNSILVTFNSSSASGNVLVFGSNECGNGAGSMPLSVTVKTSPSIQAQPVSSPVITAGSGIASFVVDASGTGLTYKWQEYSSAWNDIQGGGVYQGFNTDSMVIINPPIGMNGYRYRCVIDGFCSPSVTTDGNATLYVEFPVGFDSHSVNNLTLFDVYPIPFNDYLNIRIKQPGTNQVSIKLFDILGNEVESSGDFLTSSGIDIFKLKTTRLNAGLYTLRLDLKIGTNIMTQTRKICCSH